MKRAFFLLLMGLLLGGALGLYVGWVLYPAQLVNVTPAELTPALQADYVRLVAATYAQDDDFTAVQTRLAALRRDDLDEWLRRETVDAILAGENETEIQQMVLLATRLGLDSPAFVPYLPDPAALDSDNSQEPNN
jgi:hypothetical protein